MPGFDGNDGKSVKTSDFDRKLLKKHDFDKKLAKIADFLAKNMILKKTSWKSKKFWAI